MQVIHDGEVHEFASPPASVLELLRPLLGDGAEARVVTALRLDGECVPAEALADLSTISAHGVSRVEVDSESAHSVALRALAESSEYAARVRAAIGEVADLLRMEHAEASAERLAELIDGFSVLIGTAELVGGLLADDPPHSRGSRPTCCPGSTKWETRRPSTTRYDSPTCSSTKSSPASGASRAGSTSSASGARRGDSPERGLGPSPDRSIRARRR